MELQGSYGLLLNEKNIKLQRKYFIEMCRLIGANVVYRAPRPDKHWTTYAEIDSNYYEPTLVGCIFNEFPDQQTMKKLGWNAELDDNVSIISVPYDTENLQVGALFIIPSAIDNAKGRLFRVTKMSTVMIYPASVTCQLVPEYEDTYSKANEIFKVSSFNLLNREDDPPDEQIT